MDLIVKMRNTASFSTFKGVAHLLTTSKTSGSRHVCLLYRLWLPHSIFCEYFGTQVILCLTILKAFNVKLQQVFLVGSRSNLVCVVFSFLSGNIDTDTHKIYKCSSTNTCWNELHHYKEEISLSVSLWRWFAVSSLNWWNVELSLCGMHEPCCF